METIVFYGTNKHPDIIKGICPIIDSEIDKIILSDKPTKIVSVSDPSFDKLVWLVFQRKLDILYKPYFVSHVFSDENPTDEDLIKRISKNNVVLEAVNIPIVVNEGRIDIESTIQNKLEYIVNLKPNLVLLFSPDEINNLERVENILRVSNIEYKKLK